MDIAPAALAALGQQHDLLVFGQVRDMFAGIVIDDQRAHRHAQENIVCAFTVAIRAAAVFTVARLVQFGKTIIDQRIDITIGDRPDGAAFAAVATVWTAERPEFFAAKTRNTVAAVTSDDFDLCFVYKLHFIAAKKTKGPTTRGKAF